jgi:hypothetical protein
MPERCYPVVRTKRRFRSGYHGSMQWNGVSVVIQPCPCRRSLTSEPIWLDGQIEVLPTLGFQRTSNTKDNRKTYRNHHTAPVALRERPELLGVLRTEV